MVRRDFTCGICGEKGHKRNNKLFHPKCDKVVYPKKEKLPGGVGGNSLKNENNFIDEFNKNPDYRLKFNLLGGNWIALKPNKKDGFKIIQTEVWEKLKKGTGEKAPTPKTDVILKNLDTNEIIGISLKSGEGRATSADAYETSAILLSVLLGNPIFFEDSILIDKVYSIVDSMLKVKLKNSELNMTQMKKTFSDNKEGLGFENEFKWYSEFKISCLKCNSLWKEIVVEYPEYKFAVIKECLVGEFKFNQNIGKASKLVILENSKSVDIKDVINLEDCNQKLQNYCSKIGTSNSFAAKSSGSTLWMRFL